MHVKLSILKWSALVLVFPLTGLFAQPFFQLDVKNPKLNLPEINERRTLEPESRSFGPVTVHASGQVIHLSAFGNSLDGNRSITRFVTGNLTVSHLKVISQVKVSTPAIEWRGYKPVRVWREKSISANLGEYGPLEFSLKSLRPITLALPEKIDLDFEVTNGQLKRSISNLSEIMKSVEAQVDRIFSDELFPLHFRVTWKNLPSGLHWAGQEFLKHLQPIWLGELRSTLKQELLKESSIYQLVDSLMMQLPSAEFKRDGKIKVRVSRRWNGQAIPLWSVRMVRDRLDLPKPIEALMGSWDGNSDTNLGRLFISAHGFQGILRATVENWPRVSQELPMELPSFIKIDSGKSRVLIEPSNDEEVRGVRGFMATLLPSGSEIPSEPIVAVTVPDYHDPEIRFLLKKTASGKSPQWIQIPVDFSLVDKKSPEAQTESVTLNLSFSLSRNGELLLQKIEAPKVEKAIEKEIEKNPFALTRKLSIGFGFLFAKSLVNDVIKMTTPSNDLFQFQFEPINANSEDALLKVDILKTLSLSNPG